MGVVEAVAADLRRLADHYQPVYSDGGVFIPPWPRLLADFEAGRAITLPGWKVAAACRKAGIARPASLEGNGLYDLNAKGALP